LAVRSFIVFKLGVVLRALLPLETADQVESADVGEVGQIS
jgi:hypothetical protein